MTPTEQIKAAFTRFRSLENWDFDSLWPIISTLLILGVLVLAQRWLLKEYKSLKSQEGIEDDEKN